MGTRSRASKKLPKNSRNWRLIRRILDCSEQGRMVKPPGRYTFRTLFFKHPAFTGYGDRLLLHLGYAIGPMEYFTFLLHLFPESVSDLYLQDPRHPPGTCDVNERWCTEEAAEAFASVSLPSDPDAWPTPDFLGYDILWGQLTGTTQHPLSSTRSFEYLFDHCTPTQVRATLERLEIWWERLLMTSYFFEGCSSEEIGLRFNLSKKRINQLIAEELKKLYRILSIQESEAARHLRP